MSWRTVSVLLAIACSVLLWRDCTREPPPPPPVVECTKPAIAPRDPDHRFADSPESLDEPPVPVAASNSGPELFGFKLPSWAAWLAPHPGESLHVYRDRMLPIAMAVITPHRDRVARSRADLATTLGLDAGQLGKLDAAAATAATAIEDRVVAAVMSEDLMPATFKPMAAVGIARDVLDIVDRENHAFVDALSEDQRGKLAQHPFDFADYLVFSTKWEDLLRLIP